MPSQTISRETRVGDVVPLVVRWGSQRRLRCTCHRYLPDLPLTSCNACGTTYERVDDDNYRVVSLP